MPDVGVQRPILHDVIYKAHIGQKYIDKYQTLTAHITGHKLLPRGSSGGRLNKKDGLTRYGNSHVKDKTS